MAPTLSSNYSFFLTTTPRSFLSPKNHKLTVFAAKAPGQPPFLPFRLGKQDDQTETALQSRKPPGTPFFFDFTKLNSDVRSLIPVVTQPSSLGRKKDPGTVFVAGATGQAGIRIAQTLLRQGFKVRAAVPDIGAAQELARLAATYKVISKEESKRLTAVGSTLNDPESIAKTIANASKVVVTVGPAENGPTSEVTLEEALQVVQASQLAGVGHVSIIYDEASGAPTNNVLNGISSFFTNLFAQSQPLTITEFLEKVAETEVNYTLIKTKLTEDYAPESSYNIVVSSEGTSKGSKDNNNVSTSQIASLVAQVFSNTVVAENKVVEVSTDPSAPLKSIDQLFSAIPEDGRRKAYAEAIAKAKAEEEAIKATERAREAAEAAKMLEEEVKKLSEQEARAASLVKEAQQKAEAAGTSMENLLNRAKGISSGLSWENLSSQIATVVQNNVDNEKQKVQVATVRGQAKARTLPAKKAILKQSKPTPPISEAKSKSKPKTTETKEERKVFGGLFKQEVIYMDDD